MKWPTFSFPTSSSGNGLSERFLSKEGPLIGTSPLTGQHELRSGKTLIGADYFMLNRLKWCLQQYPGVSCLGGSKNQDI